jgi:hypothetical protein
MEVYSCSSSAWSCASVRRAVAAAARSKDSGLEPVHRPAMKTTWDGKGIPRAIPPSNRGWVGFGGVGHIFFSGPNFLKVRSAEKTSSPHHDPHPNLDSRGESPLGPHSHPKRMLECFLCGVTASVYGRVHKSCEHKGCKQRMRLRLDHLKTCRRALAGGLAEAAPQRSHKDAALGRAGASSFGASITRSNTL